MFVRLFQGLAVVFAVLAVTIGVGLIVAGPASAAPPWPAPPSPVLGGDPAQPPT